MKNKEIKAKVAKFISTLQKKLAPGEHSLTIYQACKKWPESKSRAFTILNGGDGVYFMTDEWPEYFRNNENSKVISYFKSIKILPDGRLFITTATINLEHTMNAITFKHFIEYCESSIIKVKESELFTDKQKKEILEDYEKLIGIKSN